MLAHYDVATWWYFCINNAQSIGKRLQIKFHSVQQKLMGSRWPPVLFLHARGIIIKRLLYFLAFYFFFFFLSFAIIVLGIWNMCATGAKYQRRAPQPIAKRKYEECRYLNRPMGTLHTHVQRPRFYYRLPIQ